MSSSIKTIASEYEHICNQIFRSTADLRLLKERKKQKEQELKEYLEKSKERGIIFGNTEIILEKKLKKDRLKKKEKKEVLLGILRNSGIADPSIVLAQIESAGKQGEIETSILKVKRC